MLRVYRYVILLALTALLTACTPKNQPAPAVTPQPATQVRYVEDGSALATFADVAQRLSPCVVGISTVNVVGDGYQQLVTEGVGTGVIVDESGYIMTNHHVAGLARKLTVTFMDGTQAQGRLLWSDPALDLAVLKVDGTYQAAPLGTLASVRVGDPVIAIGTPLALQFQHTVTSGIVSAVNRTLQVPTDGGASFLESLIQTDASINPGNSGGPLINQSGEVIGINTLKVTEAEGIGFAIPMDIAKPILRHFIEDGAYETPYIGVFALDSEIARYYDGSLEMDEGLYVLNIDPSGPAARAGVQQGDVLLSADGRALSTMLDLRSAVYERKVGDTVDLTLARMGKRGEVSIVLDKNPVNP